VTGRAWRNVGGWQAFLIDFLAVGNEFFWSADDERFRIEILKARCERVQHGRGENVGHIEHDIVGAAALDERL
jgi:hypothetical protein